MYEEFEDTKGVLKIFVYRRRTENTMAKRKKDKRTHHDLQNIYIKLKFE
jgi:3-phenylpropionate/cinnamic acid dioxygenase small subunit